MKKYAVRSTLDTTDKSLKGFSPFLEDLLRARGIETTDAAEAFLNPDYDKHLHDPYTLADMEKVVQRILKAIDQNEKVLMYSDYDADGIPGGVMLADFFRKIGFTNFSNYIPHRHDEGYGLHAEAIEGFAEEGVKLLITIDCGIRDFESVLKAKGLGIDVIVSDHHELGEKLPEAFAVLNPKRPDCMYPEKMLCGSGVIFKLIQAILIKKDFGLKKGAEKWFLDMVGLATLSDMVPLTGENRVFAHYGLKVLRKSPRPGLQQLLKLLNMYQQGLTEDDVGFMITPRINAASRMGKPMDAFKLLSTLDPVEAGMAAEHLNKINDERKGVVAGIVKEIKKRMLSLGDTLKSVMVMGSIEWRPSLLGLAANSIAEEIGRPVFLWGRDGGEEIKGSCRSDGKTNLVELMEKAKEVFDTFGGHKLAGGFAVSGDKIHSLEERLVKAFEDLSLQKTEEEEIVVDRKLLIDEIDQRLWNDIEKLSPFGIGNPKPLFLFENVTPSKVAGFGKQKNHLELSFEREMDKPLRAIGFFQTAESYRVKPAVGNRMNLVATVEKSFWMGRAEIRLRIVDII